MYIICDNMQVNNIQIIEKGEYRHAFFKQTWRKLDGAIPDHQKEFKYNISYAFSYLQGE